ncbi:MAG: GNAT family N-acetyltransferase [Synergistaceae bacterium]|nr:GNAT family N-acetyltransferase [Synergistaceae bacterium]
MRTLRFKKVTQSVESSPFDCGVRSINEYVRWSYYPMLTHQAYAYSIMSRDKILGYYQVMFKDINLDKFPAHIADYSFDDDYRKTTAIHLRYIAIDKKYQGLKIGTAALEVIMGKCRKLADNWPVRVITIDAKVNLIQWYRKFDFQEMPRNAESQDGVTVSMYYAFTTYDKELLEYCEGAF